MVNRTMYYDLTRALILHGEIDEAQSLMGIAERFRSLPLPAVFAIEPDAKWVEKEDKALLWPRLKGLMDSGEEFRARVGLILSLAHFLDAENLPRTLDYVVQRGFKDTDPYYIRMGAAWLMAEGLCKHFDLAKTYFQERRLSRWIHNKALQKARESWRMTDERKEYLQSLKEK